jgi:ATP-dependent exoDNAse (exonuclease V) beta subunit
MTLPTADAHARAAIREQLDDTVVVEAAAGTGKTSELVHRIIAVLASGRARVEQIAAVTFTEKAAGDLKLRLRAELEVARHAAAAGEIMRARLEHARTHLEEARVSTIHTFCADLLRERPIEAGVDPQFQVLTEADADRLFGVAFTRWLEDQLQQPGEGVRRALRRRPARNEGGPVARLRTAAWTLVENRDLNAPWRRDPFDRTAAIAAVLRQVHEFAALSSRCADPRRDRFYLDTEAVRRISAHWRRSEPIGARDDDEAEAALVALAQHRDFRKFRLPGKGRGQFYAKEIARAAVLDAHAELCAALTAFARAADADLAAALHAELRGALARYEELKRRAGVLDFVDLLVHARDLLREVASVRADFQSRLTHLFIDEFQDTDPLQAEILLLLAADDASERNWRAVRPVPGKLFIVGDPKQSIYRFRRADVGTYLEVKALLAERGATTLELTTSFRAGPPLQRFVNAAFAPHLRADAIALQADYVPLTPYRDEHPDQPTIVALPVPRPYGKWAVTQGAIEASLPDAVGAFIDWLIHSSGWTVTERENPDRRVPLAARHVCILFRRFVQGWSGTDVTRLYVRALEARGIAHLLVGGRSFHGREEVETMRAALTAVEWPDDELAVFATLRGSLFAIGDEALFVYRQTHGRLHPFRRPADLPPDLAPIGEALELLATLHRARNHRPVADTLARLLEATRAHAGFALRPSGEQILANVLHLAELARTYEATGGISFRGFVERLLEDAERGQTSEAPILEEGSEGVRIMTVHKAKGLEFPVVVLADITAGMTGGVSRWVDARRGLCALRIAGWVPAELSEHEADEAKRDEAEGLRVAYVAATRARDLLVVPAVGDEPFHSGWVSCLNGALYPPGAAWRGAQAAAGCPPFGKESVVERPAELAFNTDSVHPGVHRFDGYDVVWWDPAALKLGAEPRFGVRQEELLGKEASRELVDGNRRHFTDWQDARAAAIAAGARPRHVVQTATRRAAEVEEAAPAVAIVELPRAAGRPAGARFGALVHAVLATAPLDGSADDLLRAATVQGRLLGAVDEEIAAAVHAVSAALAHPLLQRAHAALGAGHCRRETPITLRAADGTLVEGAVDLAFLEDGAWTVIDFKTDHELSRSLDAYRRQVALYAAAIATATGHPANAVLLRV